NEVAVREGIFATPAFAALRPVEQARAYTIQGTQCAQFGDMRRVRHWYAQAIRTAPGYALPALLMPVTLFGPAGVAATLRLYRGARQAMRALRRPATAP